MEHAAVSHVWLIETLSELRIYAARNGLPELAAHLEQSIHLAHIELAVREGEHPTMQKPDTDENGQDS
ncbi:hypothetical protein [Roseinatronobacter sp.]|uniref:hypothetical protein n=1 Tax=Roseinatronobacter sp. TaxID=1945755 RepID=UPI0025F0DA4D|nr:hypothetical protein [Rhodobaca sp.]